MAGATREWFADTRAAMAATPLQGALLGLYYVYVGLWLTLSTRVRLGTHVFDHEWDLLVVLDACRVDALRAVAGEYDFFEAVGSVWSVGSTSGEWVAHTFDRAHADEIAGTAYVTANPHSRKVLRERALPPQYVASPVTRPAWDPVEVGAFRRLDEVWRDGIDDRFGVVPPRVTTDRAIRAGREGDHDRLVVHYMQPHSPYLAGYLDAADLPASRREPFECLKRGTLAREDAWAAYLDTLRLVLGDVRLLLENVDADRAVITADHGEAFGELGFYEHPVGCPLPTVKRVPWVRTEGTDEETHEPAVPPTAGTIERDVETALAHLGYR